MVVPQGAAQGAAARAGAQRARLQEQGNPPATRAATQSHCWVKGEGSRVSDPGRCPVAQPVFYPFQTTASLAIANSLSPFCQYIPFSQTPLPILHLDSKQPYLIQLISSLLLTTGPESDGWWVVEKGHLIWLIFFPTLGHEVLRAQNQGVKLLQVEF